MFKILEHFFSTNHERRNTFDCIWTLCISKNFFGRLDQAHHQHLLIHPERLNSFPTTSFVIDRKPSSSKGSIAVLKTAIEGLLAEMVRSYPNIVITGTPGTGKSTHSSLLASTYSPSCSSSSSHPLRQIDVGAVVKSEGFYTEYLEEWQSYEVNEDQLLDHLEPLTGSKAPEPRDSEDFDEEELRQAKEAEEGEERGGLILDWHTCDVWPERWVDLVVVLRCDHSVLWERLEKRFVPLSNSNSFEKHCRLNN